MAQSNESDYQLLLSYITLTRSVLNPRNNYLKSFGHATVIALDPTD